MATIFTKIMDGEIPGAFVHRQYLPDGLPSDGQRYYEPTENGVEAKIKARLLRLWEDKRSASPEGEGAP